MSLNRYQFRAQLGAGPDGTAYRAVVIADGSVAEIEIRDLSAAKQIADHWARVVPRLRTAAQLVHPGALRVIQLGLDHDPPFAVLEWVGMTTLSKSPLATATISRHDALKLVDVIAGALYAAHRLGLSHGRLGPENVFLAGVADPKLDFTGLDVGFPLVPGSLASFSSNAGEACDLAAGRAADLHGLGRLLAWLLSSPDNRRNPRTALDEIDASTSLGRLITSLLADDPAERPSAREAQEQLKSLLLPMDATGLSAQPSMNLARSDGLGMEVDGRSQDRPTFGGETLVVEAGLPCLGRYRLLDRLGEGTQGVVHRAQDSADGSMVAIKILRSDRAADPEVLKRFRKEARMLAEVNNPHVVNLLEFNEDDGIPYMVLELVVGESLDQLLRRHTRLDEKEALSIMASVARGLMEAHERGIVHRDVKPSNVLLVRPESGDQRWRAMTETLDRGDERPPDPGLRGTTAGNQALAAPSGLATVVDTETMPRVKISDFGLARHVVNSESLALTAAGALIGTPHYMAPELWTGRGVDPRTDVYAMGATLFHLLTGQPPFLAGTREELCVQHCHDPVPRAASLSPDVSDGVERLIGRALCKRPEDRYFDAGAILHDIEALLHGRPSDLAIHPRLPDCDRSQVLTFEFRWELEASPRELWPLVTNTDRLDRAIGFAPVTYKMRFEPGRGVRTFAVGKKAGMVEAGEEYPYEWVEPRRMGVLREYTDGPFRWVVSVVELIPHSTAGTTLVHSLRLEPSSWKIRLGSRWGVGVSLRKSLERVYRRIDATLKHQRSQGIAPGVDPYETPEPMPRARRQRLERLLDRLIEHGIDASVVDRLGEFLAGAPPQEVARIRPLELAQRWGIEPDEFVRACLHAARDGLLELHWDLLCPVCRISCQVTDTLRAIAGHAHCEACHLDFQLDFANSIELIFRVHPEIRPADLGTYCVGGPAHSPHVLAQIRVAASERMELELELNAGSYRLRGPQLPWSIDFQVQTAAAMRRWDVDLGMITKPSDLPALRAGHQVVVLTNPHPRELVIRIERTATRSDALTAAKAASMALFRELFPSEILAPGQLATVSMITLMVTGLDPEQADALYQELGDARAFGVIHEHIQSLGERIREGGGAVVKTMGEGVLASFTDVEAAVRTALEIVERLGSGSGERQLRPRLGIHRGTTLAATLNDHLDYFGSTARQAVATLDFARAGELILTQAVAADPGVAALLNTRNISGEVIPLKRAEMPHLIRIRDNRTAASES